MTPEHKKRFQALTKKQGRKKLARFKAEFVLLPDEAKELFLDANESRFYSEHPCTPQEFIKLTELGYTKNKQLNDARISAEKIIEFGMRQEYVPALKIFLYPEYSPDEEMLEAFKSGSIQEVVTVADKNSYKSYYGFRYGFKYLPI